MDPWDSPMDTCHGEGREPEILTHHGRSRVNIGDEKDGLEMTRCKR